MNRALQTLIVERPADLVAGRDDIASANLESEHSMFGYVIAAARAGVRTFTATSSQGLLYAHEHHSRQPGSGRGRQESISRAAQVPSRGGFALWSCAPVRANEARHRAVQGGPERRLMDAPGDEESSPVRVLLLKKRRGRDLNARRTQKPETVFETAAFDRAATPPRDRADSHPKRAGWSRIQLSSWWQKTPWHPSTEGRPPTGGLL